MKALAFVTAAVALMGVAHLVAWLSGGPQPTSTDALIIGFMAWGFVDLHLGDDE